MMKEVKLFLGADHAGFDFKEKLKKYLDKKKIDFEDLGAFVLDENDDYPDIAFKVAERVSEVSGKGILICGSGEGMEIAANKVKGIRAIAAWDVYTAKKSREHNDANILALSERDSSFAKVTKIIDAWLKTPFSDKEKHARRIKKISDYENKL